MWQRKMDGRVLYRREMMKMEFVKTNKSTYEAMKIIGATFNCVGTYEYILDNEVLKVMNIRK